MASQKKGNHQRKRCIWITVIFIFIGLGFSCIENPSHQATISREEVLTVYESKGEQGLRQLINDRKSAVTQAFIDEFTAVAFKEKKEDWFGISKIMAEETENERAKAGVFLKMGEYLEWLSEVKLPDYFNNNSALLFQNQRKTKTNSKTFYSSTGLYEKAFYLFKRNGHLTGQGTVKIKMGDQLNKLGEHLRALNNFQEALMLYRDSKNSFGQGKALSKSGDLFALFGNHLRAIKLYHQAAGLFKAVNAHQEIGAIFRKIGDVYLAENNTGKAFECYEKVLEAYKNALAAGIPENGEMYLNKGKVLFHTQSPHAALEMYDRALTRFEEEENPQGKAEVYKNKGDVLLKLRDFSGATDVYKLAASYYNKYSFKHAFDMRFYTLLGQARAHDSQGNTFEAGGFYKDAILVIQQSHHQAPFARMKQMLHQKVHAEYEEAVAFLLKNKAYGLVFKAIEFVKTQAFRDRQTEVLGNVNELMSPDIKGQLRKLANKFSEISKKRHAPGHATDGSLTKKYLDLSKELDDLSIDINMIQRGIKLTPELQEKRKEVITAQRELNKFGLRKSGGKDKKKWEELERHSRRFEYILDESIKKVTPRIPMQAVRFMPLISLVQVKKRLLKNQESLVSYFMVGEKIHALVITKRAAVPVTLDIKVSELNALVARYLQAMNMYRHDKSTFRRHSRRLYRELFFPVKEKLNSNRDIFILPEGEMVKIPFESLITGKDEEDRWIYLTEKYRIKYIQSASVLWDLRSFSVLSNRAIGKKRINSHFIGFGDPLYNPVGEQSHGGFPGPRGLSGDGDILLKINSHRYTAAGGRVDRLKESGEEVKTISRLFKDHGYRGEIYLREQANEKNVKSSYISDFGYIHFACHAVLAEAYQSLLLARTEGKGGNDGYLTLNEIMNCPFNASLVVLSACRSGTGSVRRGESIGGLARAFMHTGVPAVVASLWVVKDEATRELMVHFYRNMLEKKMSKADALREARLALLKSSKYASPYFWSAFIMYGE